jgi:hypothetical protein
MSRAFVKENDETVGSFRIGPVRNVGAGTPDRQRATAEILT